MRRREFLTLLGSAAVAWTHRVAAQPTDRVRRIGVLRFNSPKDDTFRAPFTRALSERGYVEGMNLAIEWRYADGRHDRAAELATELVGLGVDAIVAFATPAAQAVKNATATVPVVVIAGDPVGTGLVESLARPGRNITGISAIQAELNGKRLELLREVMPGLARIAVLVKPSDPFARSFVREAREAAARFKIEVHVVPVERSEELESAFQSLVQAGATAVLVQGTLRDHRAEIAALSVAHRLPSVAEGTWFTEAGGLLSFGSVLDELVWRTADLVDKILKGAKPADLPIEQPTKFKLVINLTTAKALGIALPEPVLARADEVIE